MTSHTFVTGDGCRIHYRFDAPEDGPVLVLSNSLGTTLKMWEPQMPLWSQGLRVLRYDQRGHGGSDSPQGAYSIDRLGRDVIELLDHLELEQVSFCGLSLGGMTGQWLGYRAPERLRRLVLANTSGFMGPASNWDQRIQTVLAEGMAGLGQASAERWFTPQFRQAQPDRLDQILSDLSAVNPFGYAGCCAAIRDLDLRPIASLIKTPSLVIGGLYDPSTPPIHSRTLAEAMACVELLMLETAHLGNIEQPDAFGQAVMEFVTT